MVAQNKINILIESTRLATKLQEQWLELHTSVDYNALKINALFDYTEGSHTSWFWAR